MERKEEDPVGKTCDVTAVIDARPMTAAQWGIVLTCGLAMLVDGFDAQAIGYVAPAMIKDLDIDRSLLGPIFTAGVLGMGLGNMILGLLSDKLGRKPVLIASLVLFGMVTFLKSRADSFGMLLMLQVTAGLGIGGAYPNAIALTSEYVPARRRSLLVTLSAMGFLVGTTCGGFLAAAMLPAVGWRRVFEVGGAIPLVIALATLRFIPASLRQLAEQPNAAPRIRRILARVAPDLDLPADVHFVARQETAGGSPVAELFRAGRATYTLLIWTTVFMLLVATFFVFSWLPTLFASAGLTLADSVLASTAFPIGSALSSLCLAPILRRRWAPAAFSAACVLFAVALATMAAATQSFSMLVAVVFMAGVGSGTQGITHALNVAVYPTLVRSTGVGWATGIGRLGSMLGPLVGGLLVARHWATGEILQVAAIPALIAAMSTGLMLILPAARHTLRRAFAPSAAAEPPVIAAVDRIAGPA